MDFFARQDVARRQTKWLVGYFVLTIILMVLVLYLVFVGILGFAEAKEAKEALALQNMSWWRPEILLVTTMGVLVLVALGSCYKIFSLRGGGESVAVMLGGRLVAQTTSDSEERRLLNLVEEMALASGMPVPPVYLMEAEEGINAFAAGYLADDAVIGISRGAMEYLSRDELQGVIAHEFSHILNGDMRLNIRLVGLLHGILILAIIGYYVLRLAGSSARGSSSDSKGKGGAVAGFFLVGLAIMVIGYIGLLFARLIKASVSRQREFLADASAVQFTRNPDGITGALKKIGGVLNGSYLQSPEAETASHMFFACGLQSLNFFSFATHPPLDTRIRKIDPQFDGKYPRVEKRKKKSTRRSGQGQQGKKKATLPAILPAVQGLPGLPATIPLDPTLVLAAVGAPTIAHMSHASELLASLPQELKDAAHETFSARTVVFALLLDEEDAIRQQQVAMIEEGEGAPTAQETVRWGEVVQKQPSEFRLPLIEMTQNALRAMALPQYQQFRATVEKLVKADKKLGLFEFVVQRSVILHLDRHFGKSQRPKVSYFAVRAVSDQVAGLLSILVHVGHTDETQAQAAFSQALVPLEMAIPLTPREQCSLPLLQSSLDVLAECSPAVKKRLLGAAVLAVATDGHVTVQEAELLRAIADSLDCPLPPLVPGALTVSEAGTTNKSQEDESLP